MVEVDVDVYGVQKMVVEGKDGQVCKHEREMIFQMDLSSFHAPGTERSKTAKKSNGSVLDVTFWSHDHTHCLNIELLKFFIINKR